MALGLGLMRLSSGEVSEGAALRVLHEALDRGVALFDTADVYSDGECELALGNALGKLPRDKLVIATKAFFPKADEPEDHGLSRNHLFASVEESLRRLATDSIDLHQCHRYDPNTSLEETVGAYGDLIQQGKVRHWGVSLWAPHQIDAVCRIADDCGVERPISHQAQYSILQRDIEGGLLAACERAGLGQLVFSPLAQGVLSGKFRQFPDLRDCIF